MVAQKPKLALLKRSRRSFPNGLCSGVSIANPADRFGIFIRGIQQLPGFSPSSSQPSSSEALNGASNPGCQLEVCHSIMCQTLSLQESEVKTVGLSDLLKDHHGPIVMTDDLMLTVRAVCHRVHHFRSEFITVSCEMGYSS
jgi:hypothetical protein